MRLLLVIAVLISSLSFTGVVKAADFCLEHNCQQEMGIGQDDAPSNTPDEPCHDCCLHHCGHVLFTVIAQENPDLPVDQFHVADAPSVHGLDPSGLLRPPKTA